MFIFKRAIFLHSHLPFPLLPFSLAAGVFHCPVLILALKAVPAPEATRLWLWVPAGALGQPRHRGPAPLRPEPEARGRRPRGAAAGAPRCAVGGSGGGGDRGSAREKAPPGRGGRRG